MSRSDTQTVESSITELYNRETEYQTACNNDANAEHAFKMKQAERYLANEGSIEARKAQALVDCKAEYLKHLQAKAVKDFTQVKMKDSLQALSARQSILSASARGDQSYANDRRTT